jgi:DNA repair protein RAD7
MDDETVTHLVTGCPNLTRLKLKKCFRIGDASLEALSSLKHIEHLSLLFNTPTTSSTLQSLIKSVGPNLQTLSLERFDNADDDVLSEIHNSCTKLQKLRFSANDYCTDAAYVSLFTSWANPPLEQVDFSSTRDLDYSRPDGPEEPIGLASEGFKALMLHSGSRLQKLNISSCRHISHEAFSEVFDGEKKYPHLTDMDLNFQTKVDTMIVAGLFKSCPRIKKVTAFGCFGVQDVVVPLGVALIGVPNAQDAIVQEGDAIF